MSQMRSVVVTGAGVTEVLDVVRPTPGPTDALLKVRACGICGSDAMYIQIGGIPPRQGATPLGHEIAGEIVEVGGHVRDLHVGDHVVVNPMAAATGFIGNGGATGGLADYVLIDNAELGRSVAIVPAHIPWEVAALNEPMAVARHAVNRANPVSGERAVVFGAGPIGLGALIDLSLRGVDTVVIDVQPSRLAKALEIGAQAVIETVQKIAKHGARLSIPAVHKKPVEVDFGALLSTELTITLSRGYPTEIFEVTNDIIAAWERYGQIISHTVPFDRVQEALTLSMTPGAADKVVVTFDA